MFTHLFQPTRNVRNRIYCFLLMTLWFVGDAFAEDDPIEIDPNGYTSVFDAFINFWNLLTGWVA